MYNNYKIARNKAWKTLIECKICELPLNLAKVINHYGIYLIKYSDSDYIRRHSSPTEDGYSRLMDKKPVIYYNDAKPIHRVRFTIAHEIGHILLGHLSKGETLHRNTELDTQDFKEQQANIFARDILMPAVVIHHLTSSHTDISNLCNVSEQSAYIRWERLQELRRRNKFCLHSLERQVFKNFSAYIEKKDIKCCEHMMSKIKDYRQKL